MKTGVIYGAKFYNVNEAKRTVFCKMDFSIDLNNVPNLDLLVQRDKVRQWLQDGVDDGAWKIDMKTGMITFVAEGMAIANEADEFDEVLGKKIALTRAQAEAFKIAEMFYETLMSYMWDMMMEVNRLYVGSILSNFSCKNHVHELTYGEPFENYKEDYEATRASLLFEDVDIEKFYEDEDDDDEIVDDDND